MSCTVLRIPFNLFRRKTGLDEFEIDTDFENDPKEVAASALVNLCVRDGSGVDAAVCLAVVDFLDETIGIPKDDPEQHSRLKALVEIRDNPGTRQEFLRWADTWYD